MIDVCIAALRREQEDYKYRVYVTDALQVIAENTSKFGGGKYLQARYADMALPPVPKKEETRTAEEVIDGIKDKLRKLK